MAKRPVGYEINEEDINKLIRVFKILDPKNATREGAIRYLQGAHAYSHFAAHKIVEDLMSGKLKVSSKNKKKLKKP